MAVQIPEAVQKPIEKQEAGTTRFLKGAIAVIFYIGLTIFLLGSIDHVAWFFHLYEPQNAWIVPSYGKAGSLDLAVFFLAYIAATGKAAEKVITWTFTILLSGISLYANYIYAMWYSPEKQSHIWDVNILWGLTTTGWLSPLIASSYPLFAIVFMYLIERVISKKAETAEEMRERLATLKEKRTLELEIKAVTKNDGKNAAIEAINNGMDVFNHFSKRIQKQPEAATRSSEAAAENTTMSDSEEQSGERHTDNLEAFTDDSSTTGESNQEQQGSDSSTTGESNLTTTSTGLTGRSFVTVEVAAKLLGIDPKTIHSLRRQGTLKSHPGNVGRITYASIRDYDNKRPASKRTIGAASLATDESNLIKILEQAENEPGIGIDKLDLTLHILREDPNITDEALAEKLSLKRPASARFWRLKAYELITTNQEQEMKA